MFRKGDVVSVTYRDGYDRKGQPVYKTLERAVVLSCDGDRLDVGYRDTSSAKEVRFVELSFNMEGSDILVKECRR